MESAITWSQEADKQVDQMEFGHVWMPKKTNDAILKSLLLSTDPSPVTIFPNTFAFITKIWHFLS